MAADPFWLDEALPGGWSPPALQHGLRRWLRWITPALYVVTMGVIIAVGWPYPATWLVILLLVVRVAVMAATIVGIDRRAARIERVQAQALATTGAERLGTAIHTAGHPQLEANQPVVLALKGDVVTVYGYESARPLTSFSGREIHAITPLALDDDGVFRPAPVANVTQALELKLAWKETECTCVFRKMLKVRALEWYQLLSRAQLDR